MGIICVWQHCRTITRTRVLSGPVYSGRPGRSLLSGYIAIRDSYALLENFDPSLLPHVGAGASGAVMGLGGALTILAILPALPRQRFILDKKRY